MPSKMEIPLHDHRKKHSLERVWYLNGDHNGDEDMLDYELAKLRVSRESWEWRMRAER
jgi:hypothetical protein